ncbi:oligosaccharide flippase family protein [Fructobacillus sp. M2-14]|uniref:Oligosaccharide flippase family protein n=1 Tax=Fructobacillus broussonetiae TaxID=2713173 RepID=A0ABS5R2P2_9LACO|nr:oligosaccharide flippase family protein [Fructobacillus broussonetiae]MBS9339230.1 oligosaccharide flippase family protein [Fructobacillus broussonetiae]
MTENNPRNDQNEYLSADELLAKLEKNLQPSHSSKWAFWNREKRDENALSARSPEERYQLFQKLGKEAEAEERRAKKNTQHQATQQKSQAPAKATEKASQQQAPQRPDRPQQQVERHAEPEHHAESSRHSDFASQAQHFAHDAANAAQAMTTQSIRNVTDKAKNGLSKLKPGKKAYKRQNQNDSQALVRGSFWLSVGNIVSRLLGAAFILPWLAMLGAAANQANALFSQGYNIYGILLSVATFGFPSAISKVMAQLIAKEDEDGLWSLTKQSLQIGTLLGIIFAVLLYVAAPLLSNGNANVVPVLHSLAPAVLVFPAMSMVRGIFQGHQLMHISALSEIVEQIGRIIYLLIATWIVLGANPANWTGAVVQATFAAFIGALFAIAVLAWGWVYYKDLLHPVEEVEEGGSLVYKKKAKAKANVLSFLKPDKTQSKVLEILKESWPFIIIGASTNLFLFVDQYSFFPLMKAFFHTGAEQLQVEFALFSANPNKLVMIVISFATSIAATALPILAAKKAEGSLKGIQEQVQNTFKLTALVLMPSALGMYAISDVLYKFFYPIDGTAQAGIYLLQFSSILTIIMAVFMLLAFVLQALSAGPVVVRAFFWGILVKVVFQVPMIYLFQGMGALIASAFGFGWALLMMLGFLKTKYKVSLGSIKQTLLYGYLASAAMAIVAFLVSEFSANFLVADNTKFGAGLATFLGMAAGGALLLYLYKRFGLLSQILNRRR